MRGCKQLFGNTDYEDDHMRTLSQAEIARVSGGVSDIGEGEVGPGLRGLRVPGGGHERDASLYKRLGAISRTLVSVELPPTTQMS